MTSTLGLYRPGTSPLHRLPAWVKLVALVVLGAGAVFLTYWWLVVGLLAVVAGLYALAGFGPATMGKQVRPMLFFLVFTAAYHLWTADWRRAVVVTGTLTALVLMAALVTLTTRTSRLIDVIVAAAGPLRRFGVDPERVGLMLTMGIRCVPLVAELAGQVREAQLARSNATSVRAFAVPLVVRTLRRADAMGEALVARGVDD